MPAVRKVPYVTFMIYDGTNASECLEWVNSHGLNTGFGSILDAPNGWTITNTAQDGTLTIDCPGGNNGAGWAQTWAPGQGSQLTRSGVYSPCDVSDFDWIDAP